MYKICVYAICKNEEKFVEKWYNSMKEADYIVVLDTGSTDNTLNLLAAKDKIILQQKEINPWRFDVARNESMKYIPQDTDICVCTDLDEILQEGWAEKLRKNWNKDLDRVYYTYIWSFQENGTPGVIFQYDKIHAPNKYIWHYPVHEVLKKIDNKIEKSIKIEDIILEHHPDPLKSRSNYLSLLKLSIEEEPNNDRNRHYYGRELMFHGKNKEAIEQFKIHLSLPSATWDAEKCASMRYISACSENFEEKEKWLYKAIVEAPYLREPYIDMATLQYNFKNWNGVIFFCNKALLIEKNQLFYMNNPQAWNEYPYDLLSIAYWNIKDYKKSLESINKACEINPQSTRLIKNKILIEKYLSK